MPVTPKLVAMIVLPTFMAAASAFVVTPTAALAVFVALQIPCAVLALRLSEASPSVRARFADRNRRAWITLVAFVGVLVGVVVTGSAVQALL